MANAVSSNTCYIDTAGAVNTDKPTLVSYVLVTATAASAVLVLQDNGANNPNKVDLRVATSGASQVFDFSRRPLVFPNGIKASTVTNCVATVVKSGNS